MKAKQYAGTCYIGVVGPETDYSQCRDSIHGIMRREGDAPPQFIRATKGYEARQMHIDRFMASGHDFILMLDHDMTFPPDTLEQLRSHGLPFVSGFYMRRTINPMAPVWFDYNPRGEWPHKPFVKVPERGKLHKLGASGWGCILIHREVITAVRELLKGEPEVIEDDMDILPYDLTRVMGAINGLQLLVDEQPSKRTMMPALRQHTSVLKEEIVPLRITKDAVGSDIRFPYFAKRAGYTLYGDPDVRCGHVLLYPLHPENYEMLTEESHQALGRVNNKRVNEARREWREQLAGVQDA